MYRANQTKLYKFSIDSVQHKNTFDNNKKLIISEMATNKVVKVAAEYRHVSPILVKLRHLLLGRQDNNPLRFYDQVCDRPGPEANLPDGPSHKLHDNYYFTRDGRREVELPKVLADATKVKALSAGDASDSGTAVTARVKSKTPGALFRYSE